MPVPELVLVATGRWLRFAARPSGPAHIFRRVGGAAGPWYRVAVQAQCSFVDEYALAPSTRVEYYVHVPVPITDGALRDRRHLLEVTT